MKLLLDEQLSPDIAKSLRDRDRCHDVIAIKEREEWIQLSDDAVIEIALAEHRAVVTNNLRDFRPRAAALVTSGRGHYGMVYVPADHRRTRGDVGCIAAAVEAILVAHPGDDGLRNGETWLG